MSSAPSNPPPGGYSPPTNGTHGPGPHSSVESDGHDLGPIAISMCWAMTSVAALFLGTRLYVKFTAHRGMWWDDYVLLASWSMLVAFSASTTYATKVGLGKHEGSTDDPTPLQLMIVVATVFSVLGAAWSKTSFALTLLRITKGKLYWMIWAIIVSLNIILTFNAILQFIWCTPARAAWDTMVSRKCWNRGIVVKYTIFAAAYSAVMDFLLAGVPWLVIMNLKMRRKEKIGVSVCMSLGLIAGVTSIVRAVEVPSLYASDYTYEASRLLIWTAAELATTIIAASIPVLRALLRDIVNSSYKNRGQTGSRFSNTFKSSAYTGNSRSRSDTFPRTGTVAICTSTSQKEKGTGALANIYENGESVTSLIVPSPPTDGKDFGLEHGGILKTDIITVNYDTRSERSGSNRPEILQEIELQQVAPSYIRSKPS
ncbi:hypothetical protein VP1G_03182 [Cytospora mali]|uniref:Rhodopsin domain-containing protein n=1 Tax=Cytospora mali TaxID=578113 RepID=A0A194UW09_CYTMA|nr:hypothetical protein VP1G_03182 [Valsa mali var. pyri (nom. inval.)]